MWQKIAIKVGKYVAKRVKESDEWKAWVCALLMAALLPIILLIGVLFLTKEAVASYNSSITSFLFAGGTEPAGLPANVLTFYQNMKEAMAKLIDAWDIIELGGEEDDEDEDSDSDEEDEEDEGDDSGERKLLMLIAFYAFFCNSDRELSDEEYTEFATSFATGENVPDIFSRLSEDMDLQLSEAQKENIITTWNDSYGEVFSWGDEGKAIDWAEWKEGRLIKTYHFEDGEIGEMVVQYAMTRLGDPYDPGRRGQGNYVDCSYLTWWAYQQVGIDIPTVEGPQAQYIYENGGEITEDMLVPGDLVFWSYKPWYSFRSITHTGIYAGDGYVIHASSGKKEVTYVKLFDKDKIKMYGRPY